jgi:nitroreductase
MDILTAIKQRQAIRAFLDKPVPRERIEEILDAARWTPSGVNSQPWRVAVVQGAVRQRLGERMIAALEAGEKPAPEYDYYPPEWPEPYKTRRKQCGVALYQALGIGRDDEALRRASWYANYRFFDAPVGLLIFMDRQMGQGAWLDMGMFVQNLLLAARGHGLDTCPQASLADFPEIVRQELGIDDRWRLLCGIALGYQDPAAPVNRYRLPRAEVAEFTDWFD